MLFKMLGHIQYSYKLELKILFSRLFWMQAKLQTNMLLLLGFLNLKHWSSEFTK